MSLADGRDLRAAGPFARLSRTPVAFTRPAPDLGEHTAEVLSDLGRAGETRHLGERTASTRESDVARLPFEGIKFADFSWIGVGPITAKVFADHGATVVRVESDKPADRLRLVGPFKDGIAASTLQFFASSTLEALQLDLSTPRAWRSRSGCSVADVCLDCHGRHYAELGLGYDVPRD